MINRGARLLKIDGYNMFVYVRHNMNSWQFKSGKFLKPNHWSKADTPDYIIPDIEFYTDIYENSVDDEIEEHADNQIKVSCIMPTANRRQFVSRAIKSFINQSYKNRELFIIDDGEESVADIIPVNDNRIKYMRLTRKLTIGKKRNLACDKSDGDIIIHWDDDDWYSSDWIEFQVNSLLTTNADVTGLSNPYFYQPDTDKSWQYIYPDQDMPWVHGATLCYTRQLWKRNPFPEMNIGEDVRFLWSTCPKKIVPHTRTNHYIGLIHKDNTSPKHVTDRRWNSIDTAIIINNTGVDVSKL
jgi:glycosyltransferase involved in cell wall biosynthesis